ncbi:MAG: WYL domain-containing protein [Fibrobacteres bacterium]|nr:WYL domain-containing protein [Fibrobacterota bacterium]
MKPTGSNLLEQIRTCLEAVQGSRLVTFQYKNPWNEASQWRRVEAWHVLWVQGGWYLIGRLPKRDLTMFALARVDQNIEISDKSFEPSPEHQKQLHGLLAPVDQVYRSGKLTKIRLKVDADFEPVLRDRLWDDAENLRWKRSADGDWQLWIRAFLGGPDDICTREAARKILAFGPQVRVEHPAELRGCVKEIARQVLERCVG